MSIETRYNEKFVSVLEQLGNIMLKKGDTFRARAYQKAQETIMLYPQNITSISQLIGLSGIGNTIMNKLTEYVNTGTLRVLEIEKINPINILSDIYGVGPKKAQELVDAGITTIQQLRTRQDELLNDVQKKGLQYYEDINQRIPRAEIDEYNVLFSNIFNSANSSSANSGKMEIVGSYRRGAVTSGDIDVIITSSSGIVYTDFINKLIQEQIIIEVLSSGPCKTLVITKLTEKGYARRIDFLYAPPDEFAFAILYFTGSKIFNTVMRQHGLNKGYTFNEHGIYKVDNKKKGEKVIELFTCEKDIFDFLGLEFKTPTERVDGRSVIKNNSKNNSIINSINSIYIIEQFKHNGIGILESINETQLTRIITEANNKYYNEEPIMTDNQFDIIKEFIQQKFPKNTSIFEIGAIVEKNKVKLPYDMPSMDKIKPDTKSLMHWKTKFTGTYVISCKLDGVSGLYTTEGVTPKLYTRGNGSFGQDISYLIPFLQLPKTSGIVVRGEFIIRKDVFNANYATTFANPRNTVAGLINRKNLNESFADIQFVAYEVIIPNIPPIDQMKLLQTLNIQSVHYIISDTISNEMLSSMLIHLRDNYTYEIDGLIVTNNKVYPRTSDNPAHSVAFKMILTDQIAEAKVVDVIWTPSKDGYLKPRVQIEPINLGGVTIEYATGFNASFIIDNKIGVGATIQIIRSGDVIPHINSVTVPAQEPKMPNCLFKWNNTHVDIMIENASEDPIVKEKNITGFFKGICVDGLSSGNISRLINAGYSTVHDIIQMSEQDFLTVDGFKGKMANKIYTGIHQKIKEASIVSLMSSSNIFGRGFSDKKIEIILNELPIILISTDSIEEKTVAVANIKGMSRKTAESFVEKINEFKEFLKKCDIEYKLYQTIVQQPVDNTHILFNKNIVLTGSRDKTVIDFLKEVGAIQNATVNKNTYMVIAKDKEDDTGKAEDARKLHIPIITIQEFIITYIQHIQSNSSQNKLSY
jgi:NAD-dependent DNA ligase/DNA polymerase/3'-5' exonuclease PolX